MINAYATQFCHISKSNKSFSNVRIEESILYTEKNGEENKKLWKVCHFDCKISFSFPFVFYRWNPPTICTGAIEICYALCTFPKRSSLFWQNWQHMLQDPIEHLELDSSSLNALWQNVFPVTLFIVVFCNLTELIWLKIIFVPFCVCLSESVSQCVLSA